MFSTKSVRIRAAILEAMSRLAGEARPVVWVGAELGELEAAGGTRAMASDELVQTRARASRTGPKGHAAFYALSGGGSAHLGSRLRWPDGRTSNCMQATTRNARRLGELAGAAAMVTSVRWLEASRGG
jgi:hypothetical protein